MAQMYVNLKGWPGVIAAVAILGIIGLRLVSFSDKRDDAALMQALQTKLGSEHTPELTHEMQAAVAAGDGARMDQLAATALAGGVSIDAVQVSSPLFDFSSPRDVVVKVTYTPPAGGSRTEYFLYRYGAIGDAWEFRRDTGAFHFYLNIL